MNIHSVFQALRRCMTTGQNEKENWMYCRKNTNRSMRESSHTATHTQDHGQREPHRRGTGIITILAEGMDISLSVYSRNHDGGRVLHDFCIASGASSCLGATKIRCSAPFARSSISRDVVYCKPSTQGGWVKLLCCQYLACCLPLLWFVWVFAALHLLLSVFTTS